MAPAARAPWQLRGMATDPAVRGAGAGRALVADGLARVAARGGDLVWCDARVSAAGFYERMGFTVVTERVRQAGHRPARRHGSSRSAASGWEPLELMPGIAPARKASTNSRWSSWVRRA